MPLDIPMEELHSFDIESIMLAATNGNHNCAKDPVYRQCIGAAIRDLANQVVPACSALSEAGTTQMLIRINMLSIADKLNSEQIQSNQQSETNSSSLMNNLDSTIDQAIRALNNLSKDPEQAHCEAEDILCETLRDAGLEAVANAFKEARDRIGFWYA